MATTHHSSSSSEKVLFVSESPQDQVFPPPYGGGGGSYYHTISSSSASTASKSEVHTSSWSQSSGGGTNSYGRNQSSISYGTLPVAKATAEVNHLDANHNLNKSQFTEGQEIVSLRPIIPGSHGQRFQSESAVAEMKPGRTGHQEVRQVKMSNGGMTVVQTEQVHAEYRDTGHATMATGKVRRRNTDSGQGQTRPGLVDGGQCTCCPYGYHIDLDFVNYCESLSDGSYLKKLKRLQREKRKLRKSMEVFLQQESSEQTQAEARERATFLQNVEHQNNSVNRVLDEIDSSVDHTLASIDNMMVKTGRSQRTFITSDSDGTSSSTSPQNTAKFNTFPKHRAKNIQEEISNFNATMETADSQSSLSSISTVASERNAPVSSSSFTQGLTTVTTETSLTKITHITAEKLAEAMATHLPPAEDAAASSHSTTTTITKSSLQVIREAMQTSLQRMKELEEQVKAIPVLQVRISVLKEEKRLLTLQQQAKDAKVNLRTVGSGDCRVDEFEPPVVSSPKLKTPPPVPPKPKVRSKATGDHSVLEAYLIQPELPPSYTTKDNEKYVRETYILERDMGQTAMYSPFSKPKPLTRTIGVGDGNVFDDSAFKIHEKELRTVIIGDTKASGKRNVGVECRAHTRDVGVSYALDEMKPSTRSVGVNVDTGSLLQSLSFKAEEMRSALREVLHKSVHSVGTNCDFRPQLVDRGIQFSEYSLTSTGVGDYDVNIEFSAPKPMRTIGVEAVPYTSTRSVNTDYGWRLDASTNTAHLSQENKATSTDKMRTGNATTMTDKESHYTESTQTDVGMFMRLNQIKSIGSNTPRNLNISMGTSTELRDIASDEYGLEVTFRNRRLGLKMFDKSSMTDNWKPLSFNSGTNTDVVRTQDVGIGDGKLDAFLCSFNDEEKMEETVEEVVYNQYMELSHGTNKTQEKGSIRKRKWTSNEALNASSDFTETTQIVPQQQQQAIYEEKTTSFTSSPDGDSGDDGWSSSRGMVEGEKSEGTSSQQSVYTVTQSTRTVGGDGSDGQTVTTVIRANSGGPGEAEITKQTMISNLKSELDTLQGQGQEGYKANRSSCSDSGEEGGESEEIITIKTIQGKSYYEKYLSSADTSMEDSGLGGKVMMSSITSSSSSSGVSSSEGGDRKLKSCMKKNKSGGQSKRGIRFAESVTGGFTSSSGEEDSSEEGSDTSDSFEEGSYDGREGRIVYQCQDDEAIARGQPGAKMFDQNIRETFELDKKTKESCSVIAKYLEDSTEVTTKQLNASLNVIQKEWFQVSSQKLSDEHQVEDYLSSFNEYSRRLLEYIVNLNDSNGNTAIHYAVSHCNFEIVNLLLDTGVVDLNKQNRAGYTPTMLATLAYPQTERQKEVIQRLFSMGDVNAKASKNGQTALMLAVSQGRMDIVETLLEVGANVNDKDNEGSTALMVACEHGHTDIVKLLLSQPNCDASATDNDGSTPLSIAMEAGHKDIGVLLYAHLNFKRSAQASSAIVRGRKTSNNLSPLPSPTLK